MASQSSHESHTALLAPLTYGEPTTGGPCDSSSDPNVDSGEALEKQGDQPESPDPGLHDNLPPQGPKPEMANKEENSAVLGLSFPRKLWRIVEDAAFTSVRWNDEGDMVVIEADLFQTEVLQRRGVDQIFETESIKSFIRELNLYGFSKIRPSCHSAGKKMMIYRNSNFQRDKPLLLQNIAKRKKRVMATRHSPQLHHNQQCGAGSHLPRSLRGQTCPRPAARPGSGWGSSPASAPAAPTRLHPPSLGSGERRGLWAQFHISGLKAQVGSPCSHPGAASPVPSSSLSSKGLSRVFSNTTVQKHPFTMETQSSAPNVKAAVMPSLLLCPHARPPLIDSFGYIHLNNAPQVNGVLCSHPCRLMAVTVVPHFAVFRDKAKGHDEETNAFRCVHSQLVVEMGIPQPSITSQCPSCPC
ncbi:unnamed protein product, partial [Rangifer tarandus platyrhynchus]